MKLVDGSILAAFFSKSSALPSVSSQEAMISPDVGSGQGREQEVFALFLALSMDGGAPAAFPLPPVRGGKAAVAHPSAGGKTLPPLVSEQVLLAPSTSDAERHGKSGAEKERRPVFPDLSGMGGRVAAGGGLLFPSPLKEGRLALGKGPGEVMRGATEISPRHPVSPLLDANAKLAEIQGGRPAVTMSSADEGDGVPAPLSLAGAGFHLPVPKGDPAPVSLSLSMHPQDSRWPQALGERVMWLVKGGIQQAELKLNPKHLGPLEVRIEIRHDQAAVAFSVQHTLTREALESGVSRLREMMAEAGLGLVDVDISGHHDGRGQSHKNGVGPWGDGGGAGSQEPVNEFLEVGGHANIGNGLIDLFA